MKNISLVDFPEKFEPLVVITGDRRESKPKSKGDLLAYSLSNIDLTYLLNLGLKKVRILTDKIFVLLDQEELQNLFGKTHILTIGSPAVNFLTRQINSQNLFYFDIPDTAIQDISKHEKIINDIRYDPVDLFIYKEIFERGLTPDEIIKQDLMDYPDIESLAERSKQLYKEYKALNLKHKNWKQFIHNFDRTGIFDPIDGIKHAVTLRSYNDFGILSISRNPFSKEDFFVITIAGIHGIATALGAKLLATKEALSDRPFGGIYEVTFPDYGAWHAKVDKAQIKWQTEAYRERFNTIESVLKLIDERSRQKQTQFGFFVSSPYNEEDEYFKGLNQSLKAICERYFESTETAYSINTSGEGFFPNIIEDRIKSSAAIIHILNEYKPGVLFEIGLSLGHKKRAFIVWDKKLGKLNFSKLPRTIEKINILQFDSSNEKEFHETIIEKVIQPSLRKLESKDESNSSVLEAALSNVSNAYDEKRTYLYISSTLNIYRNLINEILDDFQSVPFDETELMGRDYVNAQGYGISNASGCIFLLDNHDINGIILLGLACALQKNTLLLRKENISMWNGEFGQIKEATAEQDIQKNIRRFLKRQHNHRQ
ncbi:MAG: hypothetical protein HUU11_02185 [Anaerolineales bacterium]|nr:hypothetical protein [Anaerolineales bacterium]